MHYSGITRELLGQLRAIEPSRDGSLEYRPCIVTLTDGRDIDCVYVVPFDDYIKVWGVTPEQDESKRGLRIEEIASIRESPSRLPAKLANQIYAAGESGMGYCTFTLEFRDGVAQRYTTGNAVDFVPLPEGKHAKDIAKVVPHTTPWRREDWTTFPYHWCLYEGVLAAT
jgi:hypothetical protein